MTFFPTPVVVGTEGTSACRHALLAAVELCRATGSPLHLLHVRILSEGLHGRPITPTQRERGEQEGQALLARERAVAEEHGQVVDGVHLRQSERVDQAFAAVQEELAAGLLVIGDRGSSGSLARLLTGAATGSAAGTVKRSRASVLVVRERPDMRPAG